MMITVPMRTIGRSVALLFEVIGWYCLGVRVRSVDRRAKRHCPECGQPT
jgi:hypothetical protein